MNNNKFSVAVSKPLAVATVMLIVALVLVPTAYTQTYNAATGFSCMRVSGGRSWMACSRASSCT
jgi:hypothetical protein